MEQMKERSHGAISASTIYIHGDQTFTIEPGSAPVTVYTKKGVAYHLSENGSSYVHEDNISYEHQDNKALKEIMNLIDTFAELRHTQGHWTYNLKSHEARNAVIAALKGGTK